MYRILWRYFTRRRNGNNRYYVSSSRKFSWWSQKNQYLIKCFKIHEVPGNDRAPLELLRYKCEALRKRIYDVIILTWKEKRIFKEMGVWNYTIYNKGGKLFCKNYWGITLVNIKYMLLSDFTKDLSLIHICYVHRIDLWHI